MPTAVQQATRPAAAPPTAQSSLLQRACSCGGTPGVDGDCEACRSERLAGVQRKLELSQPGDRHEREAEAAADHVVGNGGRPPQLSPAGAAGGPVVAVGVAREVAGLRGRGSPLETTTRAEMESRFGHDFSRVRVHHDARAGRLAGAVGAVAFATGTDVVFARGRYSPGSDAGNRLLAHELAHVVQQGRGRQRPKLFRQLSPAMCATGPGCETPDAPGAGVATRWKLTLAVDQEQEGLGRLISGNVGHTWVKLTTNTGRKHSYGFWPQTGFNAKKPFSSVAGCVHHPDKAHDPPHATNYLDIEYPLSKKGYDDALAHAQAVCKAVPSYNLFSYNCTSFAVDVATAAGISPPAGTTLAIHNPNALFEGIGEERARREERRREMASPEILARKLRDAFRGLGTDEDEVYRVLSFPRATVRAVINIYNQKFNDHTGEGLVEDIKDEMSGDELDRALTLLAAAHPEANIGYRRTVVPSAVAGAPGKVWVGLIVRGKKSVEHHPGLAEQHADVVFPGTGGAMTTAGFFGEGPGSGSAGTQGLGLRGVGADMAWFWANRRAYVDLELAKFLGPRARSTLILVKVTKAQAAALAKYWKDLRADPGTFNILGRNCSTAAAAGFEQAHIAKEIAGLDTPDSLFEQLRGQYKDAFMISGYYGYTRTGRRYTGSPESPVLANPGTGPWRGPFVEEAYLK